MKRRFALLMAMSILASGLWAQTAAKKGAAAKPAEPTIQLNQPPGLYAVLDTTMGRIVCRLFPDKAPLAVGNFVGLAKGTKRWWDHKKNAWTQRRYFDGLTFHRVIPNFMIQGGDQLGTGMGNVGYTFKDEFTPDLRFTRAGLLAMANSGRNTNGAQFFITVAPTDWLNDKHTIFGEIVEGQGIAEAISQVPRDANDRPKTPVVMNKVSIVEVK